MSGPAVFAFDFDVHGPHMRQQGFIAGAQQALATGLTAALPKGLFYSG